MQHFVMGPYEYMHLLQRLGPRCFFRGVRLYCTWVLPTNTAIYATWALNTPTIWCTRSGLSTLPMMWNMFTYIIMSQYVGIFRNELNADKTKVLLKQSAEKRKQDHRDTVD